PGVKLGFGWRGGSFRLDVEAAEDAVAEVVEDDKSMSMPVHERTLGETFEDFVVIESGRNPAELRFATGPGTTGGIGRFTRDDQGSSATVAALFREFD